MNLDYFQLRHFQSWCIPRTLLKDLETKVERDQEFYFDHSTYYRESELYLVEKAWGGILSGPVWNRFLVWWHTNYRLKMGDYDE